MTRGHTSSSPHRRCRRGTVYVLVLVSTMIVTVIGLIGLTIVRQDLARSELDADKIKAGLYAQSAIELGLTEIRNNTSWRSSWTNAGTVFTRTIGRGRSSLVISDTADSSLADDQSERFLMRGIGTSGAARQMIEVQVVPTLPPLAALSGCLTTGGNISFSSGKARTTAAIWSGGNVSASSARIEASVKAAGTISGSTYTGTNTAAAEAPTMPVKATVLATYAALGTSISYSSLSSGTMQKTAISASRNPYGSTNSSGVYVIDCGGAHMTLRDSRIIGTLVVKNVGTLTLAGSLFLQSSSASMPALIVDGAMDVQLSTTDLSEATFLTNFNPSGVAYQGGTDIDVSDFYPSQIRGMVAVFGNLTIQSSGTLNVVGPVLATGSATISGAFIGVDDSGCATTPASGFTDTPTYTIDDTTWKRAVD